MIFALRYQAGEATNFFNNFLYAQSDDISGYADDTGAPIPNDPLQIAASGAIIRYEYKIALYNLYDKADQRANATFLNFNKGSLSAVVMRKFLGTLVEGIRNYSDDYPVYRLADAYLLLAEIKNKLGQDPGAEIMAVRNRAYNGSAPQFVNGTFEANELAIFYERTKEFVSEGKRWFDLRRMQDAEGQPLVFRTDLPLVGVLQNIAGQRHKILWPIDLNTMSSDPTLTGDQNPGYSGT
ncbi:SusD family protein [compost metagenome]